MTPAYAPALRRFHAARQLQAAEPSPENLAARKVAAHALASHVGKAGVQAARYYLDKFGDEYIEAVEQQEAA